MESFLNFEAFVADTRRAAEADPHFSAIITPRFLEHPERMEGVRQMWQSNPFLRVGLAGVVKLVSAVLEGELSRSGKSLLRPLRRTVDAEVEARFGTLMKMHEHWPPEHALTSMARDMASDTTSREALRAVYHRTPALRHAIEAFTRVVEHHMASHGRA